MNWAIKSAVAFAAIFSVAANGAELKPETAHEWEDYLVQANARMMDRMQRNFLWADESEQRLQRVSSGEIVVAPIQPKMPISIPHGLVHHWIGTAFIRGTHIEDVIVTVREYDQYAKFYTPTVIGAQVIEQSADPTQASDHFILTFANKHFFSKHALECENTSSYTRLDACRWYSQSRTIRVQEWAQYGTPNQHKLPAGEGTGYVWSVFNMSRFEERDGGVYVEMEAVALSRDVPLALHPPVYPIIKRVSRSTLATSLDETRKAVVERSAAVTSIKYKVGE
ncbi:MAG: hypothetical protein JOY54_15915 [Acidobacteriaceae bacterium]|nr:hypothetical protein [Acidobacteriaceae bacterium]